MPQRADHIAMVGANISCTLATKVHGQGPWQVQGHSTCHNWGLIKTLSSLVLSRNRWAVLQESPSAIVMHRENSEAWLTHGRPFT